MSRKSKRVLSMLTAILLFFSNFNGIIARAAENGNIIEDTTPPVLHSVAVDKPEASPGEDVTVSLNVTDENSGVKAVSVTMYNEYIGKVSADALYNEETGKYDAKFSITADTRPGYWKVDSIVVYDKNDNHLTYWEDELDSFGTTGYQVNNDGFNDETPPVVHSISVDKQEVEFGDEVTVSLDITDDLSEITDVLVRLQSESYRQLEEVATYNPETKKFEVKLPISYTMETGKWNVSYVSVSDKRNNQNEYYEGGELDFTNSKFTVLDGKKDDTPPVVKSVTVDKQEVKPGETVTVAIEANDDLSGIDNIFVNYRGSNGGYLSEEAVLNNETKKYVAKFQIVDTTKPGTWRISSIQASDKAYNNIDYYNGENADFSSGDFNVINDSADMTPPTVTGVTVDKTEAHPGDKVKVILDATDDKSGVESVYVDMRGTNGGYLSEEAILNSTTNKYEATFSIEETTRPGSWSISYISIGDKENNYKFYPTDKGELDLSPANFTVINENIDIVPPTLNSVSVDKKEANPGEVVKVSVDASDDQSGVDQVNIGLSGSEGGYLWGTAEYDEVTKKYEATFQITDTTKPGTWKISYINITDKAGNEIYPEGEEFDFSGSEFKVINPNADMTPPTVNSVTVDKTEAHPGDKVKVSLDVSDDKSGVESVYVEISGSNRGYFSKEAVLNSTTNKYEATFTIEETTRPGVWSISYIRIGDKENNYKTYWGEEEDLDLSPANFTVINENIDIVPPTLNSVSVDKKGAVPGEEVKVSVDASDDQSGIDQVYIGLSGSRGGNLSKKAVYNVDTKLYEATFQITDTTKPGTWKISYINITDKAGNEIYPEGEEFDFSGSEFTVTNPNADMTPPTVNSVTVDKTEAHPGDKVKVSLDVTDDKSGVEFVYVEMRGSNRGYLSKEAILNSTTNKYEATFTIGETTRPGTWSISSIDVSDKEENYKYYPDDEEDLDLSPANFTVINENIDVVPPTLKSVTVDKKEAAPGEEVKVSVNATDDQSGVEQIYISLYGSQGGNLGKNAEYNSETKMYEATFQITDTTKPGTWRISSISVTDKAGNESYQESEEFDFSGSEFTVINPNADMTPPTVNSVTVDKTEAHPGDKVKVSLEVTDDKSGVESVYVGMRGSNRGYLSKEAILNSTTNKYEATFTIGETTRPGTWSISSIDVSDKEENYKYYPNDEGDLDLSPANFTVINENIDIVPPTLNSVSVDKKAAVPGEEVKVSVAASDDQSGIDQVYIGLSGSRGGNLGKKAVYNVDTKLYEATFQITDTTKPGTWRISSINVTDKSGNEIYQESEEFDFSGSEFTVTNPNADMTPPTVNSVTVDKTEARPGDKVKVSLDVTDDKSGVASVYVEMRGSNRGYLSKEAILNSTTNKYEATFTIGETTRPGTWSISSINVGDKEENYKYYPNDEENLDLSPANFTVINENIDIVPPTLKSVTVDKKEAAPGEEVKVSVNASDDQSGIEQIYISLYGSQGGNLRKKAEYNLETKKYEATFQITDTTKPGTWKISYINITDKAGNEIYQESEEFDFSGSEFTVTNPNADMTAPTVNSVTVDKTEAHPGDKVKVSLDVTDDKSGVESVYVEMRGSNRGYFSKEAALNSTTNKYEATFTIGETTRPGTWSISSIDVSDKEENNKYYLNNEGDLDLSPANFTIINENVDIAPPTLNSVKVDKTEVRPGEEVTVSIDAQDNKSGIQYIRVDYRLPKKTSRASTAKFNSLTGKYEAKIKISEFAQAGTWKIEGIELEDFEGNTNYIFNNKVNGYPGSEAMDLSAGNFVVSNDNEDITPPEVKSISVNKASFTPGETALIEMEINDSQSGIDSVYIGYQGSHGGYYERDAVYNETTKKYVVQIPVAKNTKPGTWSLDYISVSDNQGNYQYLNDNVYDFSGSNFTVIYDAADITPPSITNISVDKKEGKPGDEITVSLTVADDKSAVEEVSIDFINEANKNFWGEPEDIWKSAIYNEQTHKYEAKIQITDKMKPGSWKVNYVSVSDSEGNWNNLHNGKDADLNNGNFTIINEKADITVPEYHGITVDKKVVNVGESITFSVDAEDSQSGISGVYLALDGTMDSYEAEYNAVTKRYDIKIPINKYYQPGIWKVKYVAIYDKENNRIVLSDKDLDFSSLEFEVMNKEYAAYQEYLATYINNITVDKKVAKPNEIVKLSLNFKDNTKINDVSIRYVGQNGKDFMRDAYLDEKTGIYEVNIPITPLFKPGYWSLVDIYVTENDDQTLSLSNNGKINFSNGDFSVNNKGLDSVPPAAPMVNEVTDQSVNVTGTAEAKTKIIVKSGDKELGTAYANSEGRFTISIEAQKGGTPLTVIAVDSSENVSESTVVKVKDITPPAKPVVNEVTDQSKEITGTAEVGSGVTVKIGSVEYTGIVDKDGNYKVVIPGQPAGTTIIVTVQDAGGNISEATTATVKDATAPSAPQVNPVTDKALEVSGKTEAGAAVAVSIGSTKYMANKPADEAGNFTVTIPQQKANTKISVTATDTAKNSSPETIVTVSDNTAPAIPTVNAVSDKSKEVTGMTEVGAIVTVTIGSAKYTAPSAADSKGNYKVIIPLQKAGVKISVTAADAANNSSLANVVIVLDKTAPGIPTVNTVSDKSKEVSGKTEVGATVTVAIGSKKYTSKPADIKGYYKVTIPLQKAGVKLLVTAKDKAGNVSTTKSVVVSDKTAPSAPTVKTSVNSTTKEVTGTAEANATITIKVGSKVIGTGTADKKGIYKVKIKAQKKKIVLSVTAADKAKNVSSATTVKVK
jgi:hypothetical protein